MPRITRPHLTALLLTAVCWGCPAEERHFGRPLGQAASRPVSDLTADVAGFLDQPVVVQGRIGSVCQTAGCWCILVDGEDRSSQLYLSFPSLSLPRDVTGRQARAVGKLVLRGDRPTFLATGIDLLPE